MAVKWITLSSPNVAEAMYDDGGCQYGAKLLDGDHSQRD